MTMTISGSTHLPRRCRIESLGLGAESFDVGSLKYYPIVRKGEDPIDTSTLIARAKAFGGNIGLEHGRRIVANQMCLPKYVHIAGQPKLLSDVFIVLPDTRLLEKGVRSMAVLICRKNVWEIITRRLDCRWPDFFYMACP